MRAGPLRIRALRAGAVAAVVVLGAAHCGGNNAASTLARLPDYRPTNKSTSTVRASPRRPLIVEWPAPDRAALDAARQHGLVVVCYDGASMALLTRCHAPGAYSYFGTERKAQVETFRTADELHANLPIGAASLEASQSASTSIQVTMNVVGTYEASAPGAARDELDGDCADATHVVVALTTGAFELATASSATLRGGASAPLVAGGGSSSADRKLLARDGDATACAQSTSRDTGPPEGCGALLRIEVEPVVDGMLPPSARACGPHAYWDGTTCVLLERPRALVCPDGTQWSGADCVPIVDTSCPPKMHFEGGHGCVADHAPPPPSGPTVHFAGGTFVAGDGGPHSTPPHRVTVGPFDLDVHEVTQAEYRACVVAGQCAQPMLLDPMEYGRDVNAECNWAHPGREGHPINCIDRERAAWYCGYAGKRLPTPDEWELAARGVEGRRYPWGGADPAGRTCWRRRGGSTCVAGGTPGDRSPEGVLDLAGNVEEWTAAQPCADEESCTGVLKGGSFISTQGEEVRAARIDSWRAAVGRAFFGVRCAR